MTTWGILSFMDDHRRRTAGFSWPSFGRLPVGIAALAALILTGCIGLAVSETSSLPPPPVEAYDTGPAPKPRTLEPMLLAGPASMELQSVNRTAAAAVGATDVPAGPGTAIPDAPRLRVYSGSLELSVVRVDPARLAISEYVTSIGGYVERSRDELLVVRVPADLFREAMRTIEAEGLVLARSVETEDVTDRYADLDRRLEIATRSRERLYALLERSEDANDQVAILREIRRLTEEIERLQGALASLGDLVRYSRITIRLVPRIQPSPPSVGRTPFTWIGRLDPLRASIGPAARDLRFDVPQTLAVFEQGRRIRAEGADGSRVRLGGRVNDPSGDAEFWARALDHHLGPLYRTVQPFASGPFTGVLLESRDPDPHFYLVMVAVRNEELLVLEAFLPNASAREQLVPQLAAMIEGGSL